MKIVYIDAQNVYITIKKSGRDIDWHKFYIYLINKFDADVVYYAVGYIYHYHHIYNYLMSLGYTMLFKKTLLLPDGTIKGNVDIDIAIRSIVEMKDNIVKKAYLVTNDGDYNTLIQTFQTYKIRGTLVTPNSKTASRLIKGTNKLIDMQDIKNYIQKDPTA